MNLPNLVMLYLFLLPTISAHTATTPPPKPKPIVRNFMVTECKKNVCLMKMRPHEKRIDKSGRIYWVKIQ